MRKRWPIVALFAVLAAAWLAFAYFRVTYKFHPNYKNYDVTSPPAKDSGNAQRP